VSQDLASGLAAAIEDLLKDDDFFIGPPAVSVLREDDGNFSSAIEQAIGRITAGGLLVTIQEPRPVTPPNPYEEQVDVTLVLGEKFTLNRTETGRQKSLRDCLSVITGLLHQQWVLDPWGPLQQGQTEFEDATDGGRVCRVTFSAQTLRQRSGA
jgi:hypothetical protein